MAKEKRKTILENLLEKDPKNKKILEQLCEDSPSTKTAMHIIGLEYQVVNLGIQYTLFSSIVGAGTGVESIHLFIDGNYIFGALTAAISLANFALVAINAVKAEKGINQIKNIAQDYIEYNNYHRNAIIYNQKSSTEYINHIRASLKSGNKLPLQDGKEEWWEKYVLDPSQPKKKSGKSN